MSIENEDYEKKVWQEPALTKLKAEETAGGVTAFDEDGDLKAGS